MNKIIIIMHIYIKLLMTINLKTFLKTLIEKNKRIVLANRRRTLEGPFSLGLLISQSPHCN